MFTKHDMYKELHNTTKCSVKPKQNNLELIAILFDGTPACSIEYVIGNQDEFSTERVV